MTLTDRLKDQIDAMTYDQLLYERRLPVPGSPMFEGESGRYFAEAMRTAKLELNEGGAAATSKRVGWE